ncbi:MAG: class I SAM-dependent methyltransferase [Promethearchaeota archaeon]|jgi:SAM-dependent methyltransferase
MLKEFYDKHRNFSLRTSTEYYISPGIKCKFDLIKTNLNHNGKFNHGIDLGSSGNSILSFLGDIEHKSFFDIANLPLNQYGCENGLHPLCGDLARLPYRDRTFDFVCALDVLEHVKNDQLAISEISRILKKDGIAVITVPHRMKFYTNQDRIIGHYRRYEINQIISLFKNCKLRLLKSFGVYGKLMRIAELQSTNPKKTEQELIKLRDRYNSDVSFQMVWDILQRILSKLMKIDAKYHSQKSMRNIGFIFIKK